MVDSLSFIMMLYGNLFLVDVTVLVYMSFIHSLFVEGSRITVAARSSMSFFEFDDAFFHVFSRGFGFDTKKTWVRITGKTLFSLLW